MKGRIVKSSIFLIILCLVCITTITLAKYIATSSDSDTLSVATISLSDNVESMPVDLGELYENNKLTYTFNVTNNDSNVSLKYKINIDTSGNIPMDIYLYDSNNNNILNNLETDYITMLVSDKRTDTYILEIKLNDNTTYLDNNLVDYLDIDIYTEQID